MNTHFYKTLLNLLIQFITLLIGQENKTERKLTLGKENKDGQHQEMHDEKRAGLLKD